MPVVLLREQILFYTLAPTALLIHRLYKHIQAVFHRYFRIKPMSMKNIIMPQ